MQKHHITGRIELYFEYFGDFENGEDALASIPLAHEITASLRVHNGLGYKLKVVGINDPVMAVETV